MGTPHNPALDDGQTARALPMPLILATATDYQGAPRVSLVAIDDEQVADHFLHPAHGDTARTHIELPLFVSDRSRLEQHWPLGPVWNETDSWRLRALFAKRSRLW